MSRPIARRDSLRRLDHSRPVISPKHGSDTMEESRSRSLTVAAFALACRLKR
jgi:hypothetical protein